MDPGVKDSKGKVEMPVTRPGQSVRGHGGTSQDTSVLWLSWSHTRPAPGGFRGSRIDHL